MRTLGVLQSQLLAAGITITTYAFSEWRKKLVVSAVPIVFPLLWLPSAVPLSTRHLLSMTFPWHSYSGGRNLLFNLATMIKSHTRDFAEHFCCDRTAAKMSAAQDWVKWRFWLSSRWPILNIKVGRSVGFLCQQPKRSLGSSAWPKHVRSIHRCISSTVKFEIGFSCE